MASKTHCDICDKVLGLESGDYQWHQLFLSPEGKQGIRFDICNGCHDTVRDKILKVLGKV